MIYGLDLFTGIGGITIALQEYVTPLCYCEIDSYAQSVLLQRMQEKDLPKAPIWDDVRTLSIEEGIPVDIIYGGFPCQDISIATNGKGLEGKRSGLVFEILRLLDETKAPFLFLENVPNIRTKGAERICKELAERGYDSRWCCLSASDLGAPHHRKRWFLLAHSYKPGGGKYFPPGRGNAKPEILPSQDRKTLTNDIKSSGEDVAHSNGERLQEGRCSSGSLKRFPLFVGRPKYGRKHKGWKSEPQLDRMADGISNRMDRIKVLGNSVVSFQVRKALDILLGGIGDLTE